MIPLRTFLCRIRLSRLVLFLLVALLGSCGTNEKETLNDNLTAATPIVSVAASQTEQISKGNEFFLKGDISQALSFYESGIRENRSIAFYNIGVSHYLLDDLDMAEDYFRRALEEDPGFEEAIMNLASVLAKKQQVEEAEEYLKKVVNKRKSARVFTHIANIYLTNGNTARAAFYYKKALELDNYTPYVLSNYANFVIGIGDVDTGIKMLEQLEPKDFVVYYNLANGYYQKGVRGGAVRNAQLALQNKANDQESYDKLARLLQKMREFRMESQALRELVAMNPSKDFRIRLAKAYLNDQLYEKALDETNFLLKDFPEDIDVNLLHYETLIARGHIFEAQDFIKALHNAVRTDRTLYYLVRHIMMYEHKFEQVKKLIAMAGSSDYANLARTVYYLKTGDYAAARTALAAVNPAVMNDYYLYAAFLAINERNYQQAEQYAANIDIGMPEYFWYNMIAYWNLRDADRLTAHLAKYRSDTSVMQRAPVIGFGVQPSLEDMGFSWRYDDSREDIIASLMYPLFMEPNDLLRFLTLGYKLLKENEKLTALQELEKTVQFSDAIKSNNTGVRSFVEGRYADSLNSFKQANMTLPNNPYIQYNMGLAHLNLGNLKEAQENFYAATTHGRLMVPAYIGDAVARISLGDIQKGKQQYAAANRAAVSLEDSKEPIPPMISAMRLFAVFGLREDSILQAELNNALKKKPDNYVKTFQSLEQYVTGGVGTLNNPRAQVYRGADLHMLQKMYHAPAGKAWEGRQRAQDFPVQMMQHYIALKHDRVMPDPATLPDDRMVRKDLVYYNMFLGRDADALKVLQSLSRTDISFPELYKASLYYFLWKRDFVNAEASFTSLDRLSYSDGVADYYIMLYFLGNYNDKRIVQLLEAFSDKYPRDYRTVLIKAALQAKRLDVGGFSDSLRDLLRFDPYILKKHSLEMVIENF